MNVVPLPSPSNATPLVPTVTFVSVPIVSASSAVMVVVPSCSTTSLSPTLIKAASPSGLPFNVIWLEPSPNVTLSLRLTL